MMLKTYLGVIEDESGLHYLRPETAQGIFINFLNVMQASRTQAAVRHRPDRQELPQRDHAGQLHLPHPRVRADGDGVLRQAGRGRGVAPVLDRRAHPAGTPTSASARTTCGTSSTRAEKLSHYSKRTVDIEYRFNFTGSEWGELEGIANRTDFDLTTHRSTRAPTSSTSTRRAASGTRRTSSSPRRACRAALMTFLVDAYTEDEAPNTKGGVDKRVGAAPRPAARPGQGGGAPAVPQRRPVAQGTRPRGRAAPQLERRLRRRRRHRPALPPPGRDRHAVLHHRRLRHPRRPGGDDPRARHDGAGAGGPRPGGGLARHAPRRGLTHPPAP